MRDVLVAELVLRRASLDAIVGRLEAAGVVQHVGMHREGKTRHRSFQFRSGGFQMFVGAIISVIVASAAHIGFMRQPRTVATLLGIVLRYAFIFIVAFSGFIAFLGHTFRADDVAQQIGWPPGNPFQSEVAVANLAFGVLGLLTIWLRGSFWLATAIGYAVFMVGAGVVHIHQLIVAGNRAPLNAGATILAADLAVPLILLVLVVIHWRLTGGDPGSENSCK